MIKTKINVVERTEEEIIAYVCDVCGKEYDPNKDIIEVQEFYHIKFTGGYGSLFGDGSRVECDICQSCLWKMIAPVYRTVGFIGEGDEDGEV
ncbi:MAG: hypothetical protein ABH983_01970 [Candidatus Micrarchaeota archaeon]